MLRYFSLMLTQKLKLSMTLHYFVTESSVTLSAHAFRLGVSKGDG